MNIDNKITDDWSCTAVRGISVFNITSIPPFILACTNALQGAAAGTGTQKGIIVTKENAIQILILASLNFLGCILALPFCRTGNVQYTLAFFGFFGLVTLLSLGFGIWVNAWALLPYSGFMMIAFAWKYSNNRPATA
jgi:hypothetical protein